jgi:hypothetical protein
VRSEKRLTTLRMRPFRKLLPEMLEMLDSLEPRELFELLEDGRPRDVMLEMIDFLEILLSEVNFGAYFDCVKII